MFLPDPKKHPKFYKQGKIMAKKASKTEKSKTSEETSPPSTSKSKKTASKPKKPKLTKAEIEKLRLGSSIQKTDNFVRSKDNGCYQIQRSKAWGAYLTQCDDPEGKELDDFDLNGIKLNQDFPKMPGDLWSRYIKLCFELCPNTGGKSINSSFHNSQLEVAVALLRSTDLKEWKIVVPRQVVSGASVVADMNENIDIVTGEEYTMFPPPGWLHAGSSHSHNTMNAFYSSIDDRSELNVPGLHVVVGKINEKANSYEYVSSIVVQKMRKTIDLDEVVDTSADDLIEDFHPKVLDYVKTVAQANKEKYEKWLTPAKDNKQNKKQDNKPFRFNYDWNTIDHSDDFDDFDLEKYGIPDYDPSKKGRDGRYFDEGGRLRYPEYDLRDDNGKLDGFYYSLNRTNSDLFDDNLDPDIYPFNSAVDELVGLSLDNGYSIEQIIDDIRRAKLEYDQAWDDNADDDDFWDDTKEDKIDKEIEELYNEIDEDFDDEDC